MTQWTGNQHCDSNGDCDLSFPRQRGSKHWPKLEPFVLLPFCHCTLASPVFFSCLPIWRPIWVLCVFPLLCKAYRLFGGVEPQILDPNVPFVLFEPETAFGTAKIHYIWKGKYAVWCDNSFSQRRKWFHSPAYARGGATLSLRAAKRGGKLKGGGNIS